MERTCVFCGNSPQTKNKEHVVPKWLISLTGNPKRLAAFGLKYNEAKFEHRMFSFDSFQFPACESCNSKYATLEGKVKPTVLSILGNNPVTESQIDGLLDWFDKVRVGLWLGFRYLDKDFFGVQPKFHISQRIARFDRLLRVYRIGPIDDGINFLGTEGAGFQYNPSLFALRINNYLFVSCSRVNLVSECLGFPYAKSMVYDRHGNPRLELKPGLSQLQPSELLASFPSGGLTFLQPMYRELVGVESDNLYHSTFVTSNSLSPADGKGGVFIERRGTLSRLRTLSLDIFRELDSGIYMNEIAALIVDQQKRDFFSLKSMLDDDAKTHSSFENDYKVIELMSDFLVGMYRKANLSFGQKI